MDGNRHLAGWSANRARVNLSGTTIQLHSTGSTCQVRAVVPGCVYEKHWDATRRAYYILTRAGFSSAMQPLVSAGVTYAYPGQWLAIDDGTFGSYVGCSVPPAGGGADIILRLLSPVHVAPVTSNLSCRFDCPVPCSCIEQRRRPRQVCRMIGRAQLAVASGARSPSLCLPNDVLRLILSNLDFHSLRHLSRVEKRLFLLVQARWWQLLDEQVEVQRRNREIFWGQLDAPNHGGCTNSCCPTCAHEFCGGACSGVLGGWSLSCKSEHNCGPLCFQCVKVLSLPYSNEGAFCCRCFAGNQAQ
jgi:hypothetical protein